MKTALAYGAAGSGLLIVLLFGILAVLIPAYYFDTRPEAAPDDRVRMEKSSGRNGKHRNSRSRERAQEDYETAKKEFDRLDRKPNKTPQEKEYLHNLGRKVKHLRQKKDFSGEHHSQKHKGN
jgi:hypothetical protein